MLRLDELDVAKEVWLKIERSEKKWIKLDLFVIVAVMTVTFMIEEYDRRSDYLKHAIYYTAAQIGCFMICLKWYVFVNVSLMIDMYQRHRYAFKTHYKKLLCL